MKILALIARLLMGLTFTVFGLNGFFHFIPGELPAGLAGQFLGALMSTHYVHVISAFEVVAGILFLIGLYVPLALALIAPIIVNILLYHAFLAPQGYQPALIVTICWIISFVYNRSAFAGIFQAKVIH